MRTTRALFFIGVFVLLLAGLEFTGVKEQMPTRVPSPDTDVPDVSATAWGVFSGADGRLLFGENVDTPLPIASVTKLITADAVLESAQLDTETTITWNDLNTYGRAGNLSYGEVYTPRELLFPLLLTSSNDASTALVRVVGEDNFFKRVTTLTEVNDLTHTAVEDGSGLSGANISTPRELSDVLTDIRARNPHVLDITRLRKYLGPYTGWTNNNPALKYKTFRGGKHGYTEEAGRTFAGIFSVERLWGTQTVHVILLGSEDIERDLDRILARLSSSLP